MACVRTPQARAVATKREGEPVHGVRAEPHSALRGNTNCDRTSSDRPNNAWRRRFRVHKLLEIHECVMARSLNLVKRVE
jgi:hypothetical protein